MLMESQCSQFYRCCQLLSCIFDSNFNTTFENSGYVDDLPALVFGIH